MSGKFWKVKELVSSQCGVNIILKVVQVKYAMIFSFYGEQKRRADVLAGDDTGVITMSVTGKDIDTCATGMPVIVRNGTIESTDGRLTIEIGRWGSVQQAPSEVLFEVKVQRKLSSIDFMHTGNVFNATTD